MTNLRLAAAMLGFCCALGAQQKVLEAIGVEKKCSLRAFSFLGDLNGDGYEDLGANAKVAPHFYTQIIFVSGKDGSLLRKLVGPGEYSWPSSVGDWNRDGVPDYYAIFQDSANSNPPISEIRSGKDDRLLDTFRPWSPSSYLYIAVANVELDGDGKPDLLLTNHDSVRPQESGYYALSSAKKLLWALPMPWGRQPGWRTVSLGDVDADGCDDLSLWDQWDTKNTTYVLSGKTGRVLYKVSGERRSDLLGSGGSTTCGDVDGDGHDDFAVSSAGSASDGVVMVFSGRTGKTLFTWRKSRSGFGASIASGQDLDQDGVNDLIVGHLSCNACWPVGGQAHVYSLRTGKEIAVVRPTRVSRYSYYGGVVRMGRPRPGNPFPVFAVWDTYRFSQSRFTAPGRISIYRMLPSGVDSFGAACKGTLPNAPRSGINDKVGPGLRVHVSGAPPATPALFLLGLSDKRWGNVNLPLPLDPLGFVGCKLFTSVDLLCPVRTGTTGIDKGYAYVDLPAVPNVTLHGQWLVLGNGPLAPGALSGALRWKR